jgi:hypothetical protein
MKSENRNPHSEGNPNRDSRGRLSSVVSMVITLLLFAGCKTTRSISHSGYHEAKSAHYYAPHPNGSDPGFEYRGELSEFDVLGITRGTSTSDADIQEALRVAKRMPLKPGSSLLLIQSGAMFPDGPMVNELSRTFRVVPFSGVPPVSRRTTDGPYESADAGNFSKSLRLAGARGGCDTVLCYWGILESENAKLATKTVSWVPVMNWVVPDEREHMRIRLKLALIDVRTGDWAVLSPQPLEDTKKSVAPRRGVADQKLVESLKQKAYEAGAKELVQRYSAVAAK